MRKHALKDTGFGMLGGSPETARIRHPTLDKTVRRTKRR
jgi:hypothetical protein